VTNVTFILGHLSLFNLPGAAYNLNIDISTVIEAKCARLERFFRPDISKFVELIATMAGQPYAPMKPASFDTAAPTQDAGFIGEISG
jgi:hypothetical protein